MPDYIDPQTGDLVIKFGGGVHSRASEEDIDIRECASGENFDLDLQNFHWRPRPPFDYLGTAPNGSEIRGFASLLKTDGTVSMLVQAGDTVYQWDGYQMNTIGSVSATAKLRGRIQHISQLDDKVLITDLNLVNNVLEWDGTTLQEVSFVNEDGSTAVSNFRAKYCTIQNERAIFANIYESSSTYPHLFVGSAVENYQQITVSNKPSSSLGDSDPFYLTQPDLRAINGMTQAFGVVATSSYLGNMYKLTGTSAKDFAFAELYPRSGASGDESVEFVGNDVIYGKQGRIESLASTDKFGDVETDDISVGISDSISDFDNWTIVYNTRKQRVYCYPNNQSQILVLYKPLMESDLSPWMKWTTKHPIDMEPTAMMTCYDPLDGLEYTFFGDGSGKLYRMEGTGSGDASQYNITSTRSSALIAFPNGTSGFNIRGWIKYRKMDEITIRVKFDFQGGDGIYSHEFTQTLTGAVASAYWGGDYYWGGEIYFGSDINKFSREIIGIAGKGTDFQITTSIESKSDFSISELGFRLEAAS